MTKVEKIKKLMEKYGLSLKDLEDVDDEEELEEEKEPKTEEVKAEKEPEVTKEVEDPKETEKIVAKEEIKAETEPKNDNYGELFESLKQEIASLKETIVEQRAKTDKAYEILAAQGEKVEEDPYAYEQKLGSCDIKPNFANSQEGQDTLVKQLSNKKIR